MRALFLGLAILALAHAVSGFALFKMLSGDLLRRESELSRLFIEMIARRESLAAADLLPQSGGGKLSSLGAEIAGLPGVARTTIYSTDGFARYSTEKELIGIKFHDNEELQQSLKGALISEIEEEGIGKAEYYGLDVPRHEALIESYMPIRGIDGSLIAVVESYRRTDDFDWQLRKLAVRILSALGASLAVLAIALSVAILRPRL